MSDISHPRSRNGWTDTGAQIKSSVGQKCPNCSSAKYRETLSLEECSACGLRFDYWGSGGNDVYKRYMQQRARAAEMARQKEENEEERNHGLF